MQIIFWKVWEGHCFGEVFKVTQCKCTSGSKVAFFKRDASHKIKKFK
jgi:hypothetical protein